MLNRHPPKWAQRLLLSFLRDELAEEVLGDLDEQFYRQLKRYSIRKARRNYCYQVLNYMRPFAIKFFHSVPLLFDMLKHNFVISSRILLKQKLFSFINIGGLAIGMTVVLLIGLWMTDEFTYNKQHDNYDRIVQVLRKNYGETDIYVNTSVPGQLGMYLANNYPNLFERVVMTFFRTEKELLTINNQNFEADGYFFQADGPEMFSLKMVHGNIRGIDTPNGILLSKTMAKKCFGDEDPIGKTIRFSAANDLTVTGIFEDLPKNSSLGTAQFFVSMSIVYNDNNPYVWDNYNMRIFAQLQPNVSLDQAENTIKDVLAKNQTEKNRPIELLLLPMKDWHLNNHFENGVQVQNERMGMILNIGMIGLFVLLLACINFINLNTARFQNRSREVGVKKTLGSQRSHLVAQFLIESLLYALAAFLLSIVIVLCLLPWFNMVSEKSIQFPWTSSLFWLISLGFAIVTALFAGSHPAIFLSSFSPIQALRENQDRGKRSARFRQGLVIFQFTISIILTIGTMAIYQQVQYAKERPKGYNQDRLITVKGMTQDYFKKYDVLRAELLRTEVVEEMAEANYPLTTTLGNNDGFRLAGSAKPFDISFNTIFVTPEYGKTTQWELLEGRDFSRELGSETGSIIISESAAAGMGLSKPIGQQIIADPAFAGLQTLTIVGVVDDMIKGSPYGIARPLMVFPTKNSLQYLFIRIKDGIAYNKAIPQIQRAFEKVLPDNPFNYQFVDDQYLSKFKAEERLANLASVFSILALLISALGLFGLSAFVAEKRTKEIGIRKIMGASVFNLWQMLSRDFSLLVLLAFIIALPVSAYFLRSWLQSFDYRISLNWWIYAFGGFSCLAVTLITISYHALKAAKSNPIHALRAELI